MCTLGAISGRYLFKNRDLWAGSGRSEKIVHDQGRYRYVGVKGHATPRERGLNSGINDAGVAVAITFVDRVPLEEALSTRTPRGVLVEEILRSCGDLPSALRRIAENLTEPLVGGTITILTLDGGAVLEQLSPRFTIELLQAPVAVRSNHFLNLRVSGDLCVSRESSGSRFERMAQLLAGSVKFGGGELGNIKTALADHEGEYPICGHHGELNTVSAVICDLRTRTLHYHRGTPCASDWNAYAL